MRNSLIRTTVSHWTIKWLCLLPTVSCDCAFRVQQRQRIPKLSITEAESRMIDFKFQSCEVNSISSPSNFKVSYEMKYHKNLVKLGFLLSSLKAFHGFLFTVKCQEKCSDQKSQSRKVGSFVFLQKVRCLLTKILFLQRHTIELCE